MSSSKGEKLDCSVLDACMHKVYVKFTNFVVLLNLAFQADDVTLSACKSFIIIIEAGEKVAAIDIWVIMVSSR